jgi:L-fuculose-phosphate aldolase
MSRDDAPLPISEDAARQALIDACLAFDARGLNHNKAGNASRRWSRGGRDGYLITPSAIPYERMTIDDIVWLAMDEDAEARSRITGAVASRAAAPSSEWRMHHVLYVSRDAGAVVHLHSPYATALACTERGQRGGIPPFHYMVAAAGGFEVRCAPYHLFGSEALAQAALTAIEGRRACLLAHHGQLAMGDTLEAAVRMAVEVEALARIYAQALAFGEPSRLSEAEMDAVIERFRCYGPSSSRDT